MGFHGGSDGKESACNAGDPGFDPWAEKILWRKEWLPTPVFFGEFHGLKILVGYIPWGHKDKDTTEQPTPPFTFQSSMTSSQPI